jgi:hypothetical protein
MVDGDGVDAPVAESGGVGEELQVRARAREEKKIRENGQAERAHSKETRDKPAAT